MHRFLERLDAAASTVVPLAYLAGMALGTAAYFTGLVADGGLAVGCALALAVELHGFLEQRRVRALWAVWMRTHTAAALADLRVHVGILAALVLFQAYNGAAFLSASWHVAPGWLPEPAQIAIRALILPAFFLASGALSPLHTDAGAILASAAGDMLHKAVRATVRQWKGRIDTARRAGLDLAPVAVALMEDAGDADGARRIRLIASGLDAAEGRAALALPSLAPSLPALAPVSALALALADTDAPATPAPTPEPEPEPPTPGGSPRERSTGAASTRGQALHLMAPPEWREMERTARADSGRTRAEQQALWDRDERMAAGILAGEPTISTRELARRLSVGRASPVHAQRADKIRRVLQPERGRGTPPAPVASAAGERSVRSIARRRSAVRPSTLAPEPGQEPGEAIA